MTAEVQGVTDTAVRELLAAVHPEHHTTHSGKAMGIRLHTVPNPTADLSNAMEELSCLFEENAAKTFARRKASEEATHTERGFATLQAHKIFPDLPNAERFGALMRWLETHPNATVQEVLSKVSTFSREPGLQAVLLQALLNAGACATNAQKQTLAAALTALSQTQTAALRAAHNLSDTIREQTSSPEAAQTWRDLYRAEVQGFTTPQACCRSLMAQYGAERFDTALAFLVRGCGAELHSLYPSLHPEALRRILQDLQCVAVLRSVWERAENVLARLKRQFGETARLNGRMLLEKMLALTEKTLVTERDVGAIEHACGWQKNAARLDFCRAWIALSRSLSPRLFRTPEDYQTLVAAGVRYLETLIPTEEVTAR